MDSLMSQVQKSAEDAPRPQKRQRVAAVNMGQDPFQVIAARLHEIRRYMIEHNKKDGNIEIEVKLGYIINKDYDGRTGPFRPGAGGDRDPGGTHGEAEVCFWDDQEGL